MAKIYKKVNFDDNIVRTSFFVLIYFLFLYTFKVPSMPFGTVLPVLCVLTFYLSYALLRGKVRLENTITSKSVRLYILWNFFLLLYVSCLLQVNGNDYGENLTPIKDYIQMMIILPIFYISGRLLFRDLGDLMKILYIGVIIQSIIILAALFSPILTIGLTLLFPEGSYNTDQYGGFEQVISMGYKVGLGVFSSGGSLKMAIGQIGACYFLINSQGAKLRYHLIIYLLIAVATSIVARTGLLISVVGLFSVFIAKRKIEGHCALGFVSLVLLFILLGYSITVLYFSTDFLEDTFQRLIKTADKGIYDTYFRGYSGEGGDNVIPPICLETIFGLGITYGKTRSGITSITDGGIMRNYSAMGLIIAFINYITIAYILFKHKKTTKSYGHKIIILFIFLVLLIGEFKEYYIYYISPMCFCFLILSLIDRERLLHT